MLVKGEADLDEIDGVGGQQLAEGWRHLICCGAPVEQLIEQRLEYKALTAVDERYLWLAALWPEQAVQSQCCVQAAKAASQYAHPGPMHAALTCMTQQCMQSLSAYLLCTYYSPSTHCQENSSTHAYGLLIGRLNSERLACPHECVICSACPFNRHVCKSTPAAMDGAEPVAVENAAAAQIPPACPLSAPLVDPASPTSTNRSYFLRSK